MRLTNLYKIIFRCFSVPQSKASTKRTIMLRLLNVPQWRKSIDSVYRRFFSYSIHFRLFHNKQTCGDNHNATHWRLCWYIGSEVIGMTFIVLLVQCNQQCRGYIHFSSARWDLPSCEPCWGAVWPSWADLALFWCIFVGLRYALRQRDYSGLLRD